MFSLKEAVRVARCNYHNYLRGGYFDAKPSSSRGIETHDKLSFLHKMNKKRQNNRSLTTLPLHKFLLVISELETFSSVLAFQYSRYLSTVRPFSWLLLLLLAFADLVLILQNGGTIIAFPKFDDRSNPKS